MPYRAILMLLLAIGLFAGGFSGILMHPYAEHYQPWTTGCWALCSLVGGVGAAGAPLSATRQDLWKARLLLALAFLGMLSLSGVVMTDALCRGGERLADGSCQPFSP